MKTVVYTGELSSVLIRTAAAGIHVTRGIPIELPDDIAMECIRIDGARWRSATPEEIEEQQFTADLNAEAARLESEAASKEVTNVGNAGTVFEEGWGPVDEPDPAVAALAVKPATGGGGTGNQPIEALDEIDKIIADGEADSASDAAAEENPEE